MCHLSLPVQGAFARTTKQSNGPAHPCRKAARKRRGGVGCSRKLAAESFAEPDFNQFSSAKFNRLLDTVNDETI
jgi:hypothetical protein